MSVATRLVSAPTALGAVVLIASLSACAPGQTDSTPPPAPPSTSASSTVAADGHDLRGRLAAALREQSPASASLVASSQTTVTVVPASWLPDSWQIVDVVNEAPPHPRRFYAALSDDGRAVVLSGRPEAFGPLLAEAGVKVGSAKTAEQVAVAFLDATRDFTTLSYRIDKIEDIRWRPKLTSTQQDARDRVVRTYRDQVAPAKATGDTAEGWTVTAWTVTGSELVRHLVSIGPDAAVDDRTETVASELPVPASK